MIVIATEWQIYNAQICLQGMTNNVGFTFSVGDTTWQFTIGIGQDKIELVPTLNMKNLV
jgi:hypothetical protein